MLFHKTGIGLHAGKEPAACVLNRYSRASCVSIHIWYAAWHGLKAIACLSIAGIMGKHRQQKSSILNYQDDRASLTPGRCHTLNLWSSTSNVFAASSSDLIARFIVLEMPTDSPAIFFMSSIAVTISLLLFRCLEIAPAICSA